MFFLRRIFNKNSEKETMDFCYKHGFKSGKKFQYNSGYPIDANWPWLISVGDNVTLATGVKLLAHDASTVKIEGIGTKSGIVEIGNNVFIGANSVVCDDIPSNSVYAGNPAKYICSFDEFSKKHRDNQESHTVFREYEWDKWIDSSEEEKENMYNKLKKTHGYL